LTNLGKTPIDHLRVGQRVITRPGYATELSQARIDSNTSRILRLEYTDPGGGGTTGITLLRPLSQVEGLGSGDQIDLNVLGMQIEGLSRVVSVESCPTIESGPGEVITGTYTGYSFNVRRLWIDGLLEPIEATGDHPIYSEDRMCFVSVSALQHGERLRTRTGTATVQSIQPMPGRWQVFNLEIGRIHQYYVSDLEVLVHNDCTQVAQKLKDIGLPGEIYRLEPTVPKINLGENGWYYHDVLYNPVTDMLVDPMRNYPVWVSRPDWLASWAYFRSAPWLFKFGPAPL
jgi:hypothetical protein